MKKGIDYGLSPIKLEEKKGGKEVAELQKTVNGLLFFFSYLYINRKAHDYICKNLQMLMDKVKALPDSPRERELYRKMLMLYQSYIHEDLELDEDPATIERMHRYRVSSFLRAKEQGITVDERIKLIRENKLYNKLYGSSESLSKTQKELLDYFAI